MDYKFIDVVRDGHVFVVTFDRPESYNALHGPAHRELSHAFDALESDQDLWAGIVTGRGDKAFCSGNDLKATAKGEDLSTPSSGFAGLCSRFDREKPLIAAVNGIAMGGGMEIALSCDIIVAASNAKFALPEVKVGLFAGAGGVQRLSRNIGRKKAMELILTGDTMTAQQALDFGIINQVSEHEGAGVMEDAHAFAQRLLKASPTSIRASKRLLNELDALEGLPTSMGSVGQHFGRILQTNDSKEGVKAFVEKRAPKWTNS